MLTVNAFFFVFFCFSPSKQIKGAEFRFEPAALFWKSTFYHQNIIITFIVIVCRRILNVNTVINRIRFIHHSQLIALTLASHNR